MALVVTLAVVLLLYGFAVIAALLGLTLLAATRFNGLLFRVITGTTAGASTVAWLGGVTPTLSYLEACASGLLGVGGWLFLLSLATLLGVWGWNLNRTGGSVVA